MINNSKMFAFIVFPISFIVALIITENFLNMYDSKKKVKYDGVKRYIRFRSPSIGHESYNRPSKNYLQYTSNLYDKEYRIEIDSLGYIYPSHQNKKIQIQISFF